MLLPQGSLLELRHWSRDIIYRYSSILKYRAVSMDSAHHILFQCVSSIGMSGTQSSQVLVLIFVCIHTSRVLAKHHLKFGMDIIKLSGIQR